MNDDLKRTIHRITDKRIDLRVPRGVTEPLRGTVTEVDTSTRRAMVRLGPGTRPVPVPYPALPVTLEPSDEVVVHRGRDGWLMLTDVLGRDPLQYQQTIDARDFGAKGDGATDDTDAIQRAIRYAGRSIGPCRFRLGGNGGNPYTYTVPGFGTTATLSVDSASPGSQATVRAALEAVVGPGNVTVETSYGAETIVFSEALGTVDLYSSLYYDTKQGPRIYPLPNSAGVGATVTGTGLFAISSTIEVPYQGVRLEFGRAAPGFISGGGVEAIQTAWYSNGLIWIGEDGGGPMVRFRPRAFMPLVGVGFSGTLIAGNYPYTTAADVGLEIVGVQASRFPQIHTLEFKDCGTLLTTDPGLRGDADFDFNIAYNQFGVITSRQLVNTGDGFRAMGDEEAPSGSTWAQNVYNNSFDMMFHVYDDGHGQVWGDSDSNWVRFMRGSQKSGGTGYGLWMQAGDGGYNRRCFWEHVTPGGGGVYAEGTENGKTTATTANAILHYYPDVGGADSPLAPTIGTGAALSWNNWVDNPPIMAGTAFP